MSNAREIFNKIKGIQSTQKITKAMEMVAASKMKRAQTRMNSSKPYLQRVLDVIAHLLNANLEYKHPYLISRSVKRAAFLVISSDRGLCGSLNNNLFRQVIVEAKQLEESGVEVCFLTVGKKAESFFSRHNFKILASIVEVGPEPKLQDLVGLLKVLLDSYDAFELDSIYVAYNEFVSTLSQRGTVRMLLPAAGGSIQNNNIQSRDYIYEPAPEALLDTLLRRYIETLVYQAVVENLACEQAARMIAMKNASDNADELIDEFNLKYNKARQAAITKELAEIAAGAEAI